MNNNKLIFFICCIGAWLMSSCGIYSFTGAAIDGKTINIYNFENRAPNVVPSLGPNLTDKVRSKILSQTGLTAVNEEAADYLMKSVITGYAVSISGMQGTTQASTNRLTITLEVDFTNTKNPKNSFKRSFSRFADFPAATQLQAIENQLMEEIGVQLAEDIFNKAFVNW